MTRVLGIFKILALVSFSFCAVLIGVGAYRAQKLAVQARDTLTSLNAVLITVNQPCGNGRPCGTLADIAKTLGTIRNTAGQIEIAANHEDKRLGVLDAQELDLYSQAHTALGNLTTDLQSANTAISGIEPVESGLTAETVELQHVTSGVSDLVHDPAIPSMLQHANGTLAHVDAATGDAQLAVHDVQQAIHSYFHPTWPNKVLHGVETVGHIIFKIVL